MGNLKVADSEYEKLVQVYCNYSDCMENTYNKYIDVLNKVCQNAISDGAVFENLKAFVQTAQLLSGQFATVAKYAATAYSVFVSEVDAADEYIY